MSAVEIADEQIAAWQREGLSAKQCLIALGKRYYGSGTWSQVAVALTVASRRMGAA